MVRKLGLLALILSLFLVSYPAAQAQGENPYATYQINVRTGPGGEYGVVVILEAGTPLVLEARNEDISWVLGRTVDGAYRGWVAARLIHLSGGLCRRASAGQRGNRRRGSGCPTRRNARPTRPTG